MIKELVKKNRSYRRFYQEKKLTRQQLMELVETARLQKMNLKNLSIQEEIRRQQLTDSHLSIELCVMRKRMRKFSDY